MTLASISLSRFAEELGGLHGWSNGVIDEFSNATTHEELPREDWVRIAATWADDNPTLLLKRPTIDVERFGVTVAFNGNLAAVEWKSSEEEAHHLADELNGYIRGSDEIDQGTRWYVIKAQIQFSDSE